MNNKQQIKNHNLGKTKDGTIHCSKQSSIISSHGKLSNSVRHQKISLLIKNSFVVVLAISSRILIYIQLKTTMRQVFLSVQITWHQHLETVYVPIAIIDTVKSEQYRNSIVLAKTAITQMLRATARFLLDLAWLF